MQRAAASRHGLKRPELPRMESFSLVEGGCLVRYGTDCVIVTTG
jgi:hypothetical protein